MDKRVQIIREWRESTEEAIEALRSWRDSLAEWERNGGELQPGDLDAAHRRMCNAMGDEWADGNPAGGGLDALAAAVRGEELPEPEVDMSEADRVKAIFG